MPTIALSMIVKNAEKHLRQCLEHAQGLVDEICIADTGSTDSSCEIARAMGATVVAIPWENDFALARNRALSQVHADWVLSLDADEMIDPGASIHLPNLIANEAVSGYLVPIRNYVESKKERLWDRPAIDNDGAFPVARQYPAYVEHQNVRLFRRDPNIYFVGRVHETVGKRIEERGGKLLTAPFWIHHFGFVLDSKERKSKHTFYREMGRLKVKELPDDAQAHFELGLVEFDNFHNDVIALELFQTACRLSPGFQTARLFAGLALLRLKRANEAIDYLRKAGNTPVALEALGDALYNEGRFTEAREAYHNAANRSPRSAGTLSKEGLADIRCGKLDAGISKMRTALRHQQDDPELHDRLVTALVWASRLREAGKAIEQKILSVPLDPRDFLRAASIMAQLKDWTRVEHFLEQGLSHFPQQESLMKAHREIQTILQSEYLEPLLSRRH